MIYKNICVFFVLMLMAFQGTSQCIVYRWMVAFEHIEARPERHVLMPLYVDFSDVYSGVGRFQLTVQFNPDVLEYIAIKNIDPSIVKVNTSTDETGQLMITWYDWISSNSEPLKLTGKAFDLEFFFIGGGSVVSISEIIVQDVWTNTLQGQVFPGSIESLSPFQVSLIAEPEQIGADLTGGGTYYPGDTVNMYANEPFNYRFIEWRREGPQDLFDDPFSASTFFIMPERHIHATAYYEVIVENPVFLTIQTIGLGSVLVEGKMTSDTMLVVSAGQSVVLEAIAGEKWVFDKWSGDASGVRAVNSIRMNTDKEVIAHFSELFPLDLYVSPDTLAVDLMGAGLFRENKHIFVSASPLEDYVFSGWSGEAEDVALLKDPLSLSSTFTMPARPVALTANYEPGLPDYYSLVLLAVPDTIGALLSQSETGLFQEGTRVDITASQVDGYDFKEWINRDGGDLSFVDDHLQAETFLIMPAAHVTLTATYEEIPPPEQHVLMISIVGQGMVLVSGEAYTDQVLVEEGSELSLLALAAAGWQFDGWQGDAGGSDSLVVVRMDQDKHLTAVFTEKPPPDRLLLIAIVGEGVVTVEGDSLSGGHPFSLWFADATEIKLTAAASAGWVFEGWSGHLAGEHTEAWLAMDADKTVTATFTAVPPPPVYTMTFSILDQQGEPVTDATISMDDIAYPPGLYIFAELIPGNYSYTVSGTGYFDVSGTVLLVDEDVFTDVVMVQDDTGTDTDISGLQPVRVYPNPVKDIASINLGAVIPSGHIQVKVIDMQGRIRDVPFYPDAGLVRLDCTGLAPGMYHLHICYDGNRELIAFIML